MQCVRETSRYFDTRILNAVPHGVCVLDGDMKVVFANRTLMSQIGCTVEMLLGKHFSELITDSYRGEVVAWIGKSAENEYESTLEGIRVRRCHQEPFYADIALGLAVGDEHPLRVVSITNITSRHEAQAADRMSRRLLEAHFNSTPLAVIEWRLDRSARLWNPAAENIFGFTQEEVASLDVFPLISEEASRGAMDSVWEQLLAQTGGESCINTNITKGGRIIQCRWHNTTLTDDNGEVIGVASLVEDITEPARAERALRESQRTLSTLMSNLPGMAYRCRNDQDWTMEFVSEGCVELTGHPSSDLLDNAALSYADLIHPDDREMVWEKVQEALDGRRAFRLLYRIINSVGDQRWVWEQGRGVFSDRDEMLSIEGFITDITSRHEAQAEIRRSQHLLAAHFERTPLAVIEWRLDRSVSLWNPAAERMFGYKHDEVSSCDAFPLIVEKISRDMVDRIWDLLITNRGGESSINTNLTKDGRVIQCRWHNTTLSDAEGNVIGIASLVEDITDSIKAQREISEANARLERVVNKLPVIVWAFDDDLVPVMWNENAAHITGYSSEQIIGNPRVLELLYPDEQDRMECVTGWAELDFGDYDEIERPVQCADGSVRRILWSNIAARCPIPGWRAWGVGIDVTDRHEAFVALRESERRYRDIIQNVDLAGVIIDERGRIIYTNELFLSLTGWSEAEAIGAHWRDVIHSTKDTHVDIGGVFDFTDFKKRTEGGLVTRSGDRRTMVWTQSLLHNPNGEGSGACALGMDVTDLRCAQAELADHRDQLEKLVEQRTVALAESQRKLEDAERLASMGRFAAGLSHDLGNMLLPVRCHLDTLSQARLEPGSVKALDAVRTGIEFLEQLGEGLAILSGSSMTESAEHLPSFDQFLLEDWWDGVQPLLQEIVPQGIVFEIRFGTDLPQVRLPRQLLTRAVMNLLVNATEAIKRDCTPNGRITFSADFNETDDLIRLEIRDNGPGIPGEIARRAAEPFFSTKTRGLSTGLGLSVVDGFARMAGGQFSIESPPDGGTIARLDLPVLLRIANSEQQESPLVAVVIEDQRVSALCKELLRAMGCMIVDGNQIEEAQYVITTSAESCPRMKCTGDMETGGPCKRIFVDPSLGMAVIRETLMETFSVRERKK